MVTADESAMGERDAASELVEAARRSGRAGLNVSTSGNVSVRVDAGAFLISAARTRLAELAREDVVRVPVDGESPVGASGAGPRPSRETPMHRAVYRALPEVGAVLHFQSPYATLLACREGPLPALDFIPEVPVYVGRVGRVPWIAPGTEALGDAVVEELRKPECRAVLLGNHGQLAVGTDLADVLERATFLEFACRLASLAEAGGDRLRCYTPDELDELRGYRSW